MNPPARLLIGLFCLNISTVGCMLPTYRLPAGYSGTYHDRLLQQSAIATEDLSPAAVGSGDAAYPSVNSGGDPRGFFYPSAVRVSPEKQQRRRTSTGNASGTPSWSETTTDR